MNYIQCVLMSLLHLVMINVYQQCSGVKDRLHDLQVALDDCATSASRNQSLREKARQQSGNYQSVDLGIRIMLCSVLQVLCIVLHIVTLFGFSLVCTFCCRGAIEYVCQISEKQVQKQSTCFFEEIIGAMLQC